ncbi:MAG: hypothetical protein QGH33_18710 [Pirellulaceae bacterium]|jgi:hypothetical protein|nr:hypothetical protein [Pirellulaceae bacterium]
MDVDKANVKVPECPEAFDVIESQIRQVVDEVVRFVRSDGDALELMHFERSLWSRVAVLFRLFVALFLAVRHQRLDLSRHEAEGWRVKKAFATRTVKTMGGAVTYGRTYLRRNGNGWFPLDAELGITADGFSWQVIDLATQLATSVSYGATQGIMRTMLGWSPSTEAIESLVMGLGQRAPAFMATQQSFDDDGEVLVIEVDGKAAPMATEAELEARRRKRKHGRKCGCGCQRHRGRKRRKGKKKKRKKRGHNSKNGRSATLVAMYTLRRGEDGKLHGPINKKIWGQFGPRKNTIAWARNQATRRGFDPETNKRVQIVIDGERCLRKYLKQQFPHATMTLDLRHCQERLWTTGRLFHKEGSKELAQWVEPLDRLLLRGRVDLFLKRLRKILKSVPKRGPGTKDKRATLTKQIGYFEERKEMMRYDEYHREDLVLATGVIEGACRYVIGERLDCSGMRWKLEGAEPLLQLRCIELNGDWDEFITWTADQTTAELKNGQSTKIRRPRPKPESNNPKKRIA